MIRHRYSKFIPGIFLLLDMICFNGGYWLSIFYNDPISLETNQFIKYELILSSIWLVTFFVAGLNRAYREAGFFEYLNKISVALIINPIVVLIFWMLVKPSTISKELLFYTYFFFGIGAIFWRVVWYYSIRFYRSRGFNIRKVAFIGQNSTTDELIKYFSTN